MKILSMSLVSLAFVSAFATTSFAGDGHWAQANVYDGLVPSARVQMLETRIAHKTSLVQTNNEPANERIVDLSVNRTSDK